MKIKTEETQVFLTPHMLDIFFIFTNREKFFVGKSFICCILKYNPIKCEICEGYIHACMSYLLLNKHSQIVRKTQQTTADGMDRSAYLEAD